MSVLSRVEARKLRHRRIRKKISGTASRPRMALAVSLRRMSVQFIDDDRGETIAAAYSVSGGEPKNVAGARTLGERAGRAVLDKGISGVVVDRGGFKYHGRVRAIVEGAMAAGLGVGSATLPEQIADKAENAAAESKKKAKTVSKPEKEQKEAT